MCALVTVVQTCALPISGHGRTSAAITGLRTAIVLAGRSTIGPFVISSCLARPQQPGCSKAGGGRCGQENCWLLPTKPANFLGQFVGRYIVEVVGSILNRSRCLAYQ